MVSTRWLTRWDRAEATTKSNAKLPKLPPFVDYKDDLDNWLLRFERFAETSQWQKESWPAYLSALLTGRALDCFCRLSTEDVKNYDAIKLALQKRYNLTEDGYRSMVRQCKPEEGENPGMFVVRLKTYLEMWIKLSATEQTYDSLRDLFVREQFIDSSPTALSVHLREKRLRSLDELSRETDAYLVARNRQMCKSKSSTHGNNGLFKSNGCEHKTAVCFLCNKTGHRAADCRTNIDVRYDVRCFKCRKVGQRQKHA
ncbi:hypothetical protein EGW08_023343 [Elysia chlorotica]|uniref:CCHC-type domain-containing protein n=1 Tax=Elysia chlorotica TaxID=188477 RepID=A0A3S1BJS1_ELYCH|nr:hypothetical protein EGW08_023343 [Elysia chlorotica]